MRQRQSISISNLSDASVPLMLDDVIGNELLEELEGSNNIMLAPWTLPPRKSQRSTNHSHVLTRYCHALVASIKFRNRDSPYGQRYDLLTSSYSKEELGQRIKPGLRDLFNLRIDYVWRYLADRSVVRVLGPLGVHSNPDEHGIFDLQFTQLEQSRGSIIGLEMMSQKDLSNGESNRVCVGKLSCDNAASWECKECKKFFCPECIRNYHDSVEGILHKEEFSFCGSPLQRFSLVPLNRVELNITDARGPDLI
ncbi:hypothetical protein P9112_006090 [Eukaryota sp. TZLM1-RC]